MEEGIGKCGNSNVVDKKKRQQESRISSASYFNCKSLVQVMNSRIQGQIKRQQRREHLVTETSRRQSVSFTQNQLRSRRAAEKIQKIKKEKDEQQVNNCSFHPHLNKIDKNFECDVVKRNELWLQQRKKKYILKRQEQIMSDLEKCTFSPQIISKGHSDVYLKNKKKEKVKDKKKEKQSYQGKSNCEGKDQFIPKKKQPLKENIRQITASQYEAGKRQLFYKLHFG